MFEKIREKASKIVVDKYNQSTSVGHQKHLANIAYTILKHLPKEIVNETVPDDVLDILFKNK